MKPDAGSNAALPDRQYGGGAFPRVWPLLLVAATIVACPGLALGANFVVNTTIDAVDAVPGNGVCATAGGMCTLRAAVQEANAIAGPHLITLGPGMYTMTIAGRGETNAATGDLNVKVIAGLTIQGAGAATTIIDGNGLARLFLANFGPLILNDLPVQNGYPGVSPGGCISNMGVKRRHLCRWSVHGDIDGHDDFVERRHRQWWRRRHVSHK